MSSAPIVTVVTEWNRMRECVSENLVHLHGALQHEGRVYFVTDFCSKGTLGCFLRESPLKLDWSLRRSLVLDIINGLDYLHHSAVGYHGALTSSACLLDGRFTIKLTGFGMRGVRRQEPRIRTPGVSEILQWVRAGTTPPYRPDVSRDDCDDVLFEMMRLCWAENPSERPRSADLRRQLSRIVTTSSSVVDDLLQRMERYANNLEELVVEKSAAFLEEKGRSEELLYQVLPRYIAEQLKRGHQVRPENFESVSIYFSDIVEFTALSASSTPLEVTAGRGGIVDMLNSLYTVFDQIISNYDVYKVETIGDAYMVVSGLPVRNGNLHGQQIALMSIALLEAIKKFRVPHRPTYKLQLRIGVHTGPAAAGVVGLKMPRAARKAALSERWER
ncbi:atrial natriuretic peptide receptor 1-like [Pollicipes pollicipes]|uniref:atrial natriuretic peptide receptor 1-like n=1 Tax=Pollicipes pollicipes TaxID=41117 RepID=UPI001884976C|nr:atrial natriuretic peptide receptor 1-like [Pollicipes pollicipes]